MATTTVTNVQDIRTELVVFLRNSDVLSTTTRGVTTTTDEFNGTGSQVTFSLTNSTVKNVRTVTVDAASQTFGVDYTVDYDAATVTFTTAPPSGTDNVDITYDFGTTDRIFGDYPQPDITLKSFPRIVVDILDGQTEELSLGGLSNMSQYTISVTFYDRNIDTVESGLDTVKEKFQNAKKDFFFFDFITPIRIGPMTRSPWGEGKIVQETRDFQILFVYEPTTP